MYKNLDDIEKESLQNFKDYYKKENLQYDIKCKKSLITDKLVEEFLKKVNIRTDKLKVYELALTLYSGDQGQDCFAVEGDAEKCKECYDSFRDSKHKSKQLFFGNSLAKYFLEDVCKKAMDAQIGNLKVQDYFIISTRRNLVDKIDGLSQQTKIRFRWKVNGQYRTQHFTESKVNQMMERESYGMSKDNPAKPWQNAQNKYMIEEFTKPTENQIDVFEYIHMVEVSKVDKSFMQHKQVTNFRDMFQRLYFEKRIKDFNDVKSLKEKMLDAYNHSNSEMKTLVLQMSQDLRNEYVKSENDWAIKSMMSFDPIFSKIGWKERMSAQCEAIGLINE